MSKLIYSRFLYGFTVDASNQGFPVKVNTTEAKVLIPIGKYTASLLAQAIEDALADAFPTQSFTVSFDYETRKFYFLCSTSFELLFSTGVDTTNNCASLIGMNETDHTVNLNPPLFDFESDFEAGFIYDPQFPLQSSTYDGMVKKLTDAIVNRSVDGQVELIYYGEENTIEHEIKYITEIDHPSGSYIMTNNSALSDTKTFLNWCIRKNYVEFFKDKTKLEINTLILEKTSFDQNGTGYKITPLYNENLPDYYTTGLITWRVIN